MTDTIKVSIELVKTPCVSSNVCEGCVFRVGRFLCMNRSLCPNTKEENVNWNIASKPIQIK